MQAFVVSALLLSMALAGATGLLGDTSITAAR